MAAFVCDIDILIQLHCIIVYTPCVHIPHLPDSKARCSRGRRPSRSATSGAASLAWEDDIPGPLPKL